MMFLHFLGSLLISITVYSGGDPKFNPSKEHADSALDIHEWKMVDEDDVLTVYERWITLPDGRKTRERKGVFYTKSYSGDIVRMITSTSGIEDWMSGVEKTRELKSNQTSGKIVYIRFDVPWPFRTRDLVTEVNTFESRNEGYTDVYFSAKNDVLPEYNNITRLLSYEAHWNITALPDGRTKVAFSVYTDTEPIVPRFIQDPVTENLFKQNLLNLHKLLAENNDKND